MTRPPPPFPFLSLLVLICSLHLCLCLICLLSTFSTSPYPAFISIYPTSLIFKTPTITIYKSLICSDLYPPFTPLLHLSDCCCHSVGVSIRSVFAVSLPCAGLDCPRVVEHCQNISPVSVQRPERYTLGATLVIWHPRNLTVHWDIFTLLSLLYYSTV